MTRCRGSEIMGTSGVDSTANFIAARSESMTSPNQTVSSCVCGNPECKILFGYCHCGCEKLAPISTQTRIQRGQLRGCPVKFIRGHQATQERPDISAEAPFYHLGDLCRRIPLTQGQWAIVDVDMFDHLNTHIWSAWLNRSSHSFHAVRTAKVREKYIRIYMSREIMGLTGKELGDHQNRDTLDNRIRNLRCAFHPENAWNAKMHVDNKVGLKGVSPHHSKFRSQICVNGIKYVLGAIEYAQKEHEVYCEAARRLFGEFARFE